MCFADIIFADFSFRASIRLIAAAGVIAMPLTPLFRRAFRAALRLMPPLPLMAYAVYDDYAAA